MNFSVFYYDIVCYVVALCTFIVLFVFFMLYWNCFSGGSVNFGADNQVVELTWTVIPTLIVLVLCALNVNFITSGLDCYSDETVKITGYQWYWSYEYSEGVYDSIVCKDGFQVDKPMRLFYGVSYRLLVTAYDVIHSFAVPDLSLKIDAVPGRINQIYFIPDRYGVFIGYCSELCGANHSLMPIVIEVVN
uniref:Cytochrome c oxidase subunit 2 n=1 Tax=Dollfusiella sp. MZUSP 7992 TaxID=2899499 RepID=A0A8K1SY55_9CEST|nr:cytochrome c oxidase subunit II [Dollfusiella sp. MZUSP 7992]